MSAALQQKASLCFAWSQGFPGTHPLALLPSGPLCFKKLSRYLGGCTNGRTDKGRLQGYEAVCARASMTEQEPDFNEFAHARADALSQLEYLMSPPPRRRSHNCIKTTRKPDRVEFSPLPRAPIQRVGCMGCFIEHQRPMARRCVGRLSFLYRLDPILSKPTGATKIRG